MNALADDIDHLQRAADAAGLVIYPERTSLTHPDPARVSVSEAVLAAMLDDLEGRRMMVRDYNLIDFEAVMLVQVARLLKLHRADGNVTKSDRFQKLGEYLRAAVEVDLNNARKSLGVMG